MASRPDLNSSNDSLNDSKNSRKEKDEGNQSALSTYKSPLSKFIQKISKKVLSGRQDPVKCLKYKHLKFDDQERTIEVSRSYSTVSTQTSGNQNSDGFSPPPQNSNSNPGSSSLRSHSRSSLPSVPLIPATRKFLARHDPKYNKASIKKSVSFQGTSTSQMSSPNPFHSNPCLIPAVGIIFSSSSSSSQNNVMLPLSNSFSPTRTVVQNRSIPEEISSVDGSYSSHAFPPRQQISGLSSTSVTPSFSFSQASGSRHLTYNYYSTTMRTSDGTSIPYTRQSGASLTMSEPLKRRSILKPPTRRFAQNTAVESWWPQFTPLGRLVPSKSSPLPSSDSRDSYNDLKDFVKYENSGAPRRTSNGSDSLNSQKVQSCSGRSRPQKIKRRNRTRHEITKRLRQRSSSPIPLMLFSKSLPNVQLSLDRENPQAVLKDLTQVLKRICISSNRNSSPAVLSQAQLAEDARNECYVALAKLNSLLDDMNAEESKKIRNLTRNISDSKLVVYNCKTAAISGAIDDALAIADRFPSLKIEVSENLKAILLRRFPCQSNSEGSSSD